MLTSTLGIILAFVCAIEGCHKNSECASGFCNGDTFLRPGQCRQLVSDGGRCLEGGNSYSCISKRCICGSCGRRVASGYRCSANSHCHSGWCDGTITIGCRGKCKSKMADGQRCQGMGDRNSCSSGKCTCGYCGDKLPNNYPCARNSNCRSGWCDGTITIACMGRCKSQGNDYQTCPINIFGFGDNSMCQSGRCEKVSVTRAICAPTKGFREGTACNEDTDCDRTQSLWCKGGRFYKSGICTRCPAHCTNGCNAIFNRNQNLKCGRMTTFEHAADLAKKISKPVMEFAHCLSPGTAGCVSDLTQGFSSCMDPATPCKVKLGGKGSACMAVNTPGLSYNYSSGPIRLSGSVKPTGGMSVEADITDGQIKLELYGKVAVKAEAVFQTDRPLSATYKRKLYLTNCIGKSCSVCKTPTSKASCKPLALFTQAFAVGYVPVIVEVKVQPVAEISLAIQTSGQFKAGLSYDNDAVINIKKAIATFDPVNGIDLDIGFENNFNKQMQKTLIVGNDAGMQGVLRVGAEITVAVNGIPISVFPAVRLIAEGNLQASSTGCLTGSFSAGIGLDAGVSLDLSVPSSGQLMGTACKALVATACKAPSTKIANCAIKVLTRLDPCKRAQSMCTDMEREVRKLAPEKLGVSFQGSDLKIRPSFSPFTLSGKRYCSGGQKPFVSQTSRVGAGILHGGGGGRGIQTCGAPGRSRKC